LAKKNKLKKTDYKPDEHDLYHLKYDVSPVEWVGPLVSVCMDGARELTTT
jgi:hypothetical protein